MRILSYVAAIIAMASQAAAQTAPSQATTPEPASQTEAQKPPAEMLEHWRRATVSLGKIENKDGKDRYKTLGSAVLAAVDERHGCLLTAKHMVFDPQKNWAPAEIRMRLAQSASSPDPDLGVKVTLTVDKQNVWQSLPDNSDLAVIPLGTISKADQSKLSDAHAVSINDFASTDDDVFQGASILVISYPQSIDEYPLSFPIARSGIIAWTNPSDRLGEPFIIDANVLPGNSGGPVFHMRSGLTRFGGLNVGGGLVLIGIVSQGRQLQIKIPVPSNSQNILQVNPQAFMEVDLAGLGAIGVIEPVSKAKKLVQQFCGP
jgi:V8-like Glu-specific endopeptidase